MATRLGLWRAHTNLALCTAQRRVHPGCAVTSRVHAHTQAADLLLFLLLTATSQQQGASTGTVQPAAPASASTSAVTTTPPPLASALACVLPRVSGSQTARAHQLYVAVRIRQTACMSDLNAAGAA